MTNLSPAAQAVLTQVKTQWHSDPEEESFNVIMADLAAAALRAAASALREAYINEEYVDSADDWLDAIAAELEDK